jgi:DNA-binding Xre family transcriptional regulator
LIDEATADKAIFKANTEILNEGKGKSILAEYLEMAKPSLT